jgi:glutaredoxin 3
VKGTYKVEFILGHAHIFLERTIMSKIEIYSKFTCPFCYRAKSVFDKKGVDYEEYEISMGGAKREEMIQRANGRTTVPQIFINDQHIGGSDDLAALEAAGKLDALLAV